MRVGRCQAREEEGQQKCCSFLYGEKRKNGQVQLGDCSWTFKQKQSLNFLEKGH
ncbi:hypothetical protein [Bacillus sp. UMB0893]|uniref:hypothetical protein n=1 Tax=Bacillus sp. UMB0893 TaxID=2066053 RepID=UPI001C610DA4|nr:hypothetical protein [Bacillus sp. UMB0893]